MPLPIFFLAPRTTRNRLSSDLFFNWFIAFLMFFFIDAQFSKDSSSQLGFHHTNKCVCIRCCFCTIKTPVKWITCCCSSLYLQFKSQTKWGKPSSDNNFQESLQTRNLSAVYYIHVIVAYLAVIPFILLARNRLNKAESSIFSCFFVIECFQCSPLINFIITEEMYVPCTFSDLLSKFYRVFNLVHFFLCQDQTLIIMEL